MGIFDALTSVFSNGDHAEESVRLGGGDFELHQLALLDEDLRYNYALLMAGILTHHGALSVRRTGFFLQILKSLRLGDIRAALFEEARSLTKEKLLISIGDIKAARGARNFIMDSYVIINVDKASEEESRALEQISALLGMDSNEVAEVKGYANIITQSINKTSPVNDLEKIIVESWPSKVPEAFDPSLVFQGQVIKNKLFLVNRSAILSGDWNAENCIFYFLNGSNIATNATVNLAKRNFSFSFKSCRFITGIFSLSLQNDRDFPKALQNDGRIVISFIGCEIAGRYDSDKIVKINAAQKMEVAAISIDCQDSDASSIIEIIGCNFTTKYLTPLKINNNFIGVTKINGSKFSACNATAVVLAESGSLSVINSVFHNCQAVSYFIVEDNMKTGTLVVFEGCHFKGMMSPFFCGFNSDDIKYIFRSCVFEECQISTGLFDSNLKISFDESKLVDCELMSTDKSVFGFNKSTLDGCSFYKIVYPYCDSGIGGIAALIDGNGVEYKKVCCSEVEMYKFVTP